MSIEILMVKYTTCTYCLCTLLDRCQNVRHAIASTRPCTPCCFHDITVDSDLFQGIKSCGLGNKTILWRCCHYM